MEVSFANQLVSVFGIICTSVITSIIAPLALRWWDKYKEKQNLGLMVGTKPDKTEYAFTSLVLGIINLFAGIFPICGMPITIATVLFGFAGYNSSRRTLALIGLTMALLGLCINLIMTFYLSSRDLVLVL